VKNQNHKEGHYQKTEIKNTGKQGCGEIGTSVNNIVSMRSTMAFPENIKKG
jgi:hypothetical protein